MKHPTQMSSGDPDFQLTEEESLRPYCTPSPNHWSVVGTTQDPESISSFLKNLPIVGGVRLRDRPVLLLK